MARGHRQNALGLLHVVYVSSKEFIGGDSAARTALHMRWILSFETGGLKSKARVD